MTRIPSFSPTPDGWSNNADLSPRSGAEKLAAKIRHAWSECGHKVRVDVIEINAKGKRNGDNGARYGIRSSLVNGLPA